jgi:hypothetical protein
MTASISAVDGVGASVPHLDFDPFSIEFFTDPFPVHEKLREAGPLVYLDKWNVYGVARYAEVHAVLNDPATLCSGRGVGLSDFSKEKPWRPQSIILEADPPAHTRTRSVLNQVLSATALKPLRAHFTGVAESMVDGLLSRGSFDAVPDLAEAYPLSVFPDALGLRKEGRENLLPYASLVFNAFGPPNELRREAIERSAPHQSYVNAQCQRENLAPGGFGACVHARVDAGTSGTKKPRFWYVRCSRRASTPRSTGSARPYTVSLAFPISSLDSGVTRRLPATRSRRPSASKAQFRPSFARRPAPSTLAGIRSAKAKKCSCFSRRPTVILDGGPILTVTISPGARRVTSATVRGFTCASECSSRASKARS